VTHDQIEAMTMADRIVVMRDGLIEQVGTPLELYDRPRTAFVAQFIGSPSMNLIAARTQQAQGEWQLVTDDGQRLPLLPGLQAQGERDLWLGVRPEHVQLEVEPRTGLATNAATVEVVEPTGAETQVVSRFGKHPLISTVKERLALAPGQALHWHTAAQHWHVFDRQSGERLNVA
jgi:multiple sugar transport system ATP-binding protein